MVEHEGSYADSEEKSGSILFSGTILTICIVDITINDIE